VFTSDPEVSELANKCVLIVILVFFPDMIQGAMQGVIRALGIQRKASYWALASFYLLGIPFASLLAFKLSMGVAGLWLGITVGIAASAFIYVVLVLRTDWQAVADDAEKRILEEAAL